MNLIDLFTFYLTVVFILGTLRRLRQYRDVVNLARTMPGRWPKVLGQIKKHWVMFFTWSTYRPALVALVLMAAQMICSRIIFPQAKLTFMQLVEEWWMLPVVGLSGIAMIAIDGYFLFKIGHVDRGVTEKYLDVAEKWMTSWKAPAIRLLTFGIVNPRKIVDMEVKKALEQGRGMLHRSLWWISLQATLRVLFGLFLWVSWAVHPNIVR